MSCTHVLNQLCQYLFIFYLNKNNTLDLKPLMNTSCAVHALNLFGKSIKEDNTLEFV